MATYLDKVNGNNELVTFVRSKIPQEAMGQAVQAQQPASPVRPPTQQQQQQKQKLQKIVQLKGIISKRLNKRPPDFRMAKKFAQKFDGPEYAARGFPAGIFMQHYNAVAEKALGRTATGGAGAALNRPPQMVQESYDDPTKSHPYGISTGGPPNRYAGLGSGGGSGTLEAKAKVAAGLHQQIQMAMQTARQQPTLPGLPLTGSAEALKSFQKVRRVARMVFPDEGQTKGWAANIEGSIKSKLGLERADGVPLTAQQQFYKDGLGFQLGGSVPGFQGGGFTVPGSGNGDKVPLMVPGGSYVLNKNAAATIKAQAGQSIGGGGDKLIMTEPGERVYLKGSVPDWAPKLNAEIPRFQSGGHVDFAQRYGNPATGGAPTGGGSDRIDELIGVVKEALGIPLEKMVEGIEKQHAISQEIGAQPIEVTGEIPLVAKGAIQVQGQGGSAKMDQAAMGRLTSAVARMLPADQQGMLQAGFLLNKG